MDLVGPQHGELPRLLGAKPRAHQLGAGGVPALGGAAPVLAEGHEDLCLQPCDAALARARVDHEAPCTPARRPGPAGDLGAVVRVDDQRDAPRPATQGPSTLAAVTVAKPVLHGRIGRPVVRERSQGSAGSPGPGPVARSGTEATVQRKSVTGNLLVETVAPVLGAQLGRGVGERGPVAEVPVGEVIVDQEEQFGLDTVVDRVEGTHQLGHLRAAERRQGDAAEHPRAQHRLPAEDLPGVVPADQHKREMCSRVVVEVAEELYALAGEPLCLVDLCRKSA